MDSCQICMENDMDKLMMQNGFFGHTEGTKKVSAGLKNTKIKIAKKDRFLGESSARGANISSRVWMFLQLNFGFVHYQNDPSLCLGCEKGQRHPGGLSTSQDGCDPNPRQHHYIQSTMWLSPGSHFSDPQPFLSGFWPQLKFNLPNCQA